MLGNVQSTLEERSDARWHRLMARRLEMTSVEAFRYLRSRGVEPLLVKGWAAARNYPAANPRFYQDLDLAVSEEDFDKAKAALATDEGQKLNVDLHRELKHLDTKPWSSMLADSLSVELDGYPIRIPAAEDHLRILAVHWLNDGGERKSRLWDIYYAVVNRPDSFDWDKCLNEAGPRRREWILAAIGLTHRYLGLPIDDVPFAEEAKALPQWLIKTVEREWRSGLQSIPLIVCLRDPAAFLRQLRKRIPPNPLQATIEMEGDIRHGSRMRYQLGSMRKRFLPSIKGVSGVIRSGSR